MKKIFKGIVLFLFVTAFLFLIFRVKTSAHEYGIGTLSWPFDGRVTQEYGCLHDSFAKRSYPSCDQRQGGFHNGLDIAAPCGTIIKAPTNGMLVASGNSNSSYGRWIALMHNSKIGIFNFISNGEKFSSREREYTSGSFNFEKTKIKSGDINGDGKEDIVAIYGYRQSQIGIWVFKKTDTGYLAKRWWLSCPTCWKFANTNLQVGDVNNDGKDDITLVYAYGSTSTSIWNFISNGNGFSSRNKAFTHDSFAYSRVKFTQGDVTGDGRDDIVTLYKYSSDKIAIIVFEKTDTSYRVKVWRRLSGWSWDNSTLKVGDINNDSVDDVVIVYGYPSKIAIWDFISSGNDFNYVKKSYTRSEFYYSKSKFALGDVTGDGKDDVVAMYNYGNGIIGFWIFERKGTGYLAKIWWKSGEGRWDFKLTNLEVGDLDNSGRDDIIPVYGYGSLYTLYAHLSSFNVSGAAIEGQQIAKVGTTGYSTGCHLHFMTGTSLHKINGIPVMNHKNPRYYLK